MHKDTAAHHTVEDTEGEHAGSHPWLVNGSILVELCNLFLQKPENDRKASNSVWACVVFILNACEAEKQTAYCRPAETVMVTWLNVFCL